MAARRGRLSPLDVLRLAGYGLRARPLRVVLSALGISIGIAAMIAVVGISTSSRAELNRRLDALGTNLLTAGPGLTLFGENATLPDESVAMIGRADAAAWRDLDTRKRRTRTPLIVSSPDLNVLAQVRSSLAQVVSTSTSACWARCSAM